MRNFLRKLFSTDVSPTIVSTYNNFGFEHLSDVKNLNQYKESLYLFIAVSKIAKRASGVPLDLHRIKNLQGDTEEILDHQLIEAFSTPNSMQTRREFMEMSFAHYLLAGDCFWYLIREGNKVAGFLPLMPDRIEIVLNQANTEIIGYEYQNGEYTKIAPEDIVHIKNPDPSNILRGVGMVRPATTRILTEKDAAKYQASFFENYGRPDVAILMNRAMSENTAAEGRKIWKDTFGKGGNEAKVGFFGNDTRDIKELNKTPKEMDFIESMHFLRDDILAALGVPKAMVTTDDVNLANSKEAYRMFLQEAVVPVLDAFVDTINHRLIPRVDETVFYRYEDPTPADRDMELKEVTELKKHGIITANEARERYEYELIEGGDQLSQSNNNARVEVQQDAKAILRHRKTLVLRLKASESFKNALTEPKRSMNSIFPTKEMKVAYAKAVNDRIDRKAETLKDAIDKFHEGQLSRILESDLTPDGFMDIADESNRSVLTACN